MPKTVEICCSCCGHTFEKNKSEYNRGLKRGYRQFCSRECDYKYKQDNRNEYVKHLREWQTSEENREHFKKAALKRWGEDKTEPFREFLRRARKTNARKGTELNLTIEELKTVWNNQNGTCPYTGWKLILPKSNKNKTPKTASLDRIDSSKGYILGNVQFVCVMANLAKCDFSDEDMKEFCKAVASK